MAKILIVDDSSFARSKIKKVLDEMNIAYSEAKSGSEAIEQLEKFKPDLVTLDLLMPGMTGLETIIKMKSMQPELKVVIVTADIQNKTREELLQAGASAFVNKPVEEHKLSEIITNLIHE